MTIHKDDRQGKTRIGRVGLGRSSALVDLRGLASAIVVSLAILTRWLCRHRAREQHFLIRRRCPT